MRTILKRSGRLSFCIVLIITLGGCASLFNPHRGPTILSVEEGRLDDGPSSSPPINTTTHKGAEQLNIRTIQSPKQKFKQNLTVDGALLYAYHVWDDYNTAVQDHSRLNSSGGVVITGLTAASLASGAAGVPAKTVLGLAAGAGGTYAGVTFLHSTPRQLLYLAGMDAINCAILVTLPFNLSTDDLALLEKSSDIDISRLKNLEFNANLTALQIEKGIQTTLECYRQLTNDFANSNITSREIKKFSSLQQMSQILKETDYFIHQNQSKLTNLPDPKVVPGLTQAIQLISRDGDKGSYVFGMMDVIDKALSDSKATISAARISLTLLKSELTNADQIITAGPAVINDANNLYGKYQMAAGELVHQVNTIRTSVSAQILATEPSLASLASALGVKAPQMLAVAGGIPNPTSSAAVDQSNTNSNSSSSSETKANMGNTDENKMSPSTSDPASTVINAINILTEFEDNATPWLKQEKPVVLALAQAARELSLAYTNFAIITSNLVAETTSNYHLLSPVRSMIDRVNSQIGTASLADCVVSNSSQANISVLPQSPITVYLGQTSQIFVEGGHPQYFISWPISADTNNFTITQKMITTDNGKNQLELDVSVNSSKKIEGTHVFFIKDMTGTQKTVILSVTDKSP